MLRSGGLALLTACILHSQTPVDDLRFEAALSGRKFAPRERVAVRLTISNPSQKHTVVPDPGRSPALRVRLRTPTGEKQFSAGETMRPPGVPPTRADWRLPPGNRRTFDFDVAALARVSDRGNYTVNLEYALPGGTTWKSPDLNFSIAPAAGASLTSAESESSRRGASSLLWTERDGTNARVLWVPSTPPAESQEIWGATAAATIPASATPLLSKGPSGLDFPDRWLVWLEGSQLRYTYLARDSADALPPAGTPVQTDAKLIRTPLADAPPSTGRASCQIAWLAGGNLHRAMIDAKGQARVLSPLALSGQPVDGWAASPAPGVRIYAIALQLGDQTQLSTIHCQGETCAAPVSRFRVPGRIEAGDLRVVGTDVAAGFVVSRSAGWSQVTLRLGGTTPPKTETLSSVTAADHACIRVDSSGSAYVALGSSAQIAYFRPGTTTPLPIPRPGPLFDLLVGSAPQLAVYDPTRGPRLIELPQ